ncbi:MAG: redoxin domain-containing protein [Gallionella sp.]|nr:redoxin domain-containing protein [Gallionella sp.]
MMSAENLSQSKVWLRRGIEVLLVVALIAGIRAWQQRDIVSGAAPALQGVLLDGKPFALATGPAQPVLVHFWATWCSVCRMEQGAIEAIAHDNPNVITVAMQSGSRDEVAKYLREQGLSFPVVNDPDGRVAAAWGVHAVPASFIVDTDGRIRFVEIGYTTGVGLRLRLWLAGIMG